MTNMPLGLYIHIPFCARICHYCDFAKSANFDGGHVRRYFDILRSQSERVIGHLPEGQKFSSVYFGGGTPGLFGEEYADLMAAILPVTASGAEITMEANPLNVTVSKAREWRGLGFNRLSLGIQSFQERGLKALTREHSVSQARAAMEISCSEFPFVNGDLIYGWSGQTNDDWQADLEAMAATGCGHISAYALTYEGQTPMARAERRGALTACADEVLYDRYLMARRSLAAGGYGHEEVSNWARPGHEARHNWLYWQCHSYVGLGCGAHGFIDDQSGIGFRYSFDGDFRKYLRSGVSEGARTESLSDFFTLSGAREDLGRTPESWVLEYVSSTLRCREGVSLKRAGEMGFEWSPNALSAKAMGLGVLSISDDGQLRLREDEWFRETGWSRIVCDSLRRK